MHTGSCIYQKLNENENDNLFLSPSGSDCIDEAQLDLMIVAAFPKEELHMWVALYSAENLLSVKPK
jgi:hypothetical protein